VFQKANRSLKCCLSYISGWLAAREYPSAFETLSAKELNDLLGRYYTEARTAEGKEYTKSSLINLRASLNLYLRNEPHNRQINILRDEEFQSSNNIFLGVIKPQKQARLGVTTHKTAISITDADMDKLLGSEVLNPRTPARLFNRVWIYVMLLFGRRGRERQHYLKKSSIIEQTDGMGRIYYTLDFYEADKFPNDCRMYSDESDTLCPFKCLKYYLGKLNPNCQALFQKPRNNPIEGEPWYIPVRLGHNKLCNMMKFLSNQAQLSRVYTNQSLCATIVTKLHHVGVATENKMAVTEHGNQQSILSYVQGPSDEQCHEMSHLLMKGGENKTSSVPVCKPPSAAVGCSGSHDSRPVNLDNQVASSPLHSQLVDPSSSAGNFVMSELLKNANISNSKRKFQHI
jgi:hypothetical protein